MYTLCERVFLLRWNFAGVIVSVERWDMDTVSWVLVCASRIMRGKIVK